MKYISLELSTFLYTSQCSSICLHSSLSRAPNPEWPSSRSYSHPDGLDYSVWIMSRCVVVTFLTGCDPFLYDPSTFRWWRMYMWVKFTCITLRGPGPQVNRTTEGEHVFKGTHTHTNINSFTYRVTLHVVSQYPSVCRRSKTHCKDTTNSSVHTLTTYISAVHLKFISPVAQQISLSINMCPNNWLKQWYCTLVPY